MSKPQAAAGLLCPLFRKDVSKVCHRCNLYTLLRGKNSNTGEPVDGWHCSFNVMTLMQVETAKEVRSAAAETAELRKTVIRTNHSGEAANQLVLPFLSAYVAAGERNRSRDDERKMIADQ